jgi:hypothetical protein
MKHECSSERLSGRSGNLLLDAGPMWLHEKNRNKSAAETMAGIVKWACSSFIDKSLPQWFDQNRKIYTR